jgi:L-iditol 2-dehydrogenase
VEVDFALVDAGASVPKIDRQSPAEIDAASIPTLMKAGVYRGKATVQTEWVEVPAIEAGELLVRVEACGVCITDIKKIQKDLLPGPRIYGHETAGVIARVGEGVQGWSAGDRVVVFHHIPCGRCFYCERKQFAQCAIYKKVGVTAGFEPSGGGFAEYVRVRDWVVKRGVVRIPAEVSFEQASFLEPVNTCLKAIKRFALEPWETVLVVGQGPIGLLLTMLARRVTQNVYASDPVVERRERALRIGAAGAYDPKSANVANEMKLLTEGRGADLAIVATAAPGIVEQAIQAVRPGGRIGLFAQTSPEETLQVRGASVCVDEKTLIGSYSAAVDLIDETAELVFSGALPVSELITHRLGLSEIRKAIELAAAASGRSLKVMLCPQLP